MIYPSSFEAKIGFAEIRSLLRERCMSTMGKERVDAMAFSGDSDVIGEWLSQVREFRHIQATTDAFPLSFFFDVREAVGRLRLEGTHMETDELFDLRRSLDTIARIVAFLTAESAEGYPALRRLTDGIGTFPDIVRRTDLIIDKFGCMRDDASAELSRIRRELKHTEGSISRTLNAILHSVRSEGIVERDTVPTMRDGRLVIPVAPAMKRRIGGIVHDESASGKTVFIEPTEVVEANNRIRLLQSDERREMIRILRAFADELRPHVAAIVDSYRLLADIDFIRAKTLLAELIGGCEPMVVAHPHIDLIHAVHPLLRLSLAKKGEQVVPLDIQLSCEPSGDNFQLPTSNFQPSTILIISGPNAGGKSVCLKTVGLLQYMVQCGLSVPVGERSTMGVFRNIMIDIGDEQSIENDLSTYSGHLYNMKMMMRHADEHTLLLIDEFGAGTEPQIGAAIAESVLSRFHDSGTFAVITTHYQNLKHFADSHEGVVNGAMLYDRHEMRPLFRLAIGRPGSSFAIEIARKIGLPDDVVRRAIDIVGSEYIQSDKYLQDIVRDKRYWEGKRQEIHRREKELQQTAECYEDELRRLKEQRKDILLQARQRAEELLAESNSRIERTIREIRESQAEREDTKRLRRELADFRQTVVGIADDDSEAIDRKIEQIKRRRERRSERRKGVVTDETRPAADAMPTRQEPARPSTSPTLSVGSTVRIKGLSAVGIVKTINGRQATVVFGDMRTKIAIERIEPASGTQRRTEQPKPQASAPRAMRENIDNKRLSFKPDIDVRGMRGDEAVNAVTYFIDDATLVGINRVRILHGTGTGILRQLIRQYLATVPTVSTYRDEHVQFGGAGITVVELSY